MPDPDFNTVVTERAQVAIDIVNLEETLRQKKERFRLLGGYVEGYATSAKDQQKKEDRAA